MKVIDWLYEVIEKFKISDRSIMFQAIELMDLYYRRCPPNMQTLDLQLTAVACFFVAAKNIMLDPFTLQNAIDNMCYSKFSTQEFLEKEHDIRKVCGYVNELPNHLDYASFFMKLVKLEFFHHLREKRGYQISKVLKSTNDFFKEFETLTYEFCKLALCDGYTKRYLKSYVASSLMIAAFEIQVDLIMRDTTHKLKYDTNHVTVIERILEKVFSKYFGYNKYVFF